jgi:hypothetical protein
MQNGRVESFSRRGEFDDFFGSPIGFRNNDP